MGGAGSKEKPNKESSAKKWIDNQKKSGENVDKKSEKYTKDTYEKSGKISLKILQTPKLTEDMLNVDVFIKIQNKNMCLSVQNDFIRLFGTINENKGFNNKNSVFIIEQIGEGVSLYRIKNKHSGKYIGYSSLQTVKSKDEKIDAKFEMTDSIKDFFKIENTGFLSNMKVETHATKFLIEKQNKTFKFSLVLNDEEDNIYFGLLPLGVWTTNLNEQDMIIPGSDSSGTKSKNYYESLWEIEKINPDKGVIIENFTDLEFTNKTVLILILFLLFVLLTTRINNFK